VSESTEMYLLKIALAQDEGEPVPIPHLAELLEISQVSTNQMCRKLQDEGLVDYLPYRGVTLTSAGRAAADRVIRRRRLWEVFFVELLGLGIADAEAAACAFEHVTTDAVADRLAAHLGAPPLCPHGKPIPARDGDGLLEPRRALSTLCAGERGRVVGVTAEDPETDFLRRQGVSSGVEIDVLAAAGDGSVLINTSVGRVAVSRSLASAIDVAPMAESAR